MCIRDRSWGEPKVEGLMYGAGTSLIEIFPNVEEGLPQGAIRHFALATDDVDSLSLIHIFICATCMS